MLAGQKVQKLIDGLVRIGFIKIQLTEIGNIGLSTHTPAYAIEIYVECENGQIHTDVLDWNDY